MDKEKKSKINRTQSSPKKNGIKESPKRKGKKGSQKIAMTSRKETYDEERSKTIKEYIFPQNTSHLLLLIRLHDLFLLRSGF